MTEKRFFLLSYKNNPIYDSLTDKEYNAQFKKQKQNICELLNEQHETIQQAKELIKKQYNENSDLIKENKQLKQQNEYVFRQIKAFRDDCHVYQDFNGQSTLNRLLDILEDGKEMFE